MTSTPANSTTEQSFRLEHRLPGTSTWTTGTVNVGAHWSYSVRAKAEQRLAEARAQWPDVEHRMVAITTTVTETVVAPSEVTR